MATIHINRAGTSLGTFSEQDVREGLIAGRFQPGDLGWREGMTNWQPLSQFTEFADVQPTTVGTAATAPPLPPPSKYPEATIVSPSVPIAGRTEPLAVWSFVLSILSLVCCGFILGIPAVICGHLALGKFEKQPGLQGKGLATAGLVIGYLAIVFWLTYVVFFGGSRFLQALRESSH